MVKVIDNEIIINEFELQSCYYVYFRTNNLNESMITFILSAKG